MGGKTTAKIIGWTDAQDAELARLAGTMPPHDLAEQLGRNFRQMQVRASALDISLAFQRTYTYWTIEDDRALRRFMDGNMTAEDLEGIAAVTGDYEIQRVTQKLIGIWLGKTKAAVAGRLMKFKREDKQK